MDRRTLLATLAGAGVLAGCQGFAGRESGETASPAPVPETGAGAAEPTATAGGAPSVTWTAGPAMPQRRAQTTAAALGGEVYVVGGLLPEGVTEQVAGYDPGAGEWRTVAPLPERLHHTAAVGVDGRLHVVGGYTGPFPGSTPVASHWVYDPDGDTWREGPPLPTARGALVAGAAGGKLYAVGGAAGGTVGTVEAFDLGAGEWEAVGALPTPREHLAAGVVDGRLYAAGGRRGFSSLSGATACYADGWTERAPMPTPRAGIAGAVLGGRLFVFGGEEVGERVFEAVEAYDPRTDAWTAVEPMPTPRWGLGAAAVGDRVYTVGGGTVPSGAFTGTLEVLALD